MGKEHPANRETEPSVRLASGFCINCDNKHGCKSKSPPCVAEMRENNIKGRSGKEYLVEQRKTHRCTECSFFRDCWNSEEYARLSK